MHLFLKSLPVYIQQGRELGPEAVGQPRKMGLARKNLGTQCGQSVEVRHTGNLI